jgi:biotin operon repressor
MVKLWIYLLVRAQQFQDGSFHGKPLKTGQLITGRKKLAIETGMSEQQVRTCLNRLKSTNEITIESTNQYSLITIVKYGEYQFGEDDINQQNVQQISHPDNQQITSDQPTDNQRITTSKIERKKDRKNIQEEINKEELDCSPEFAEALGAYEEMRKKIRKPLTAKAKQMVLKKLESMATDEETQIAILNQSTMNSWQGIFPLRDTQESVQRKGIINVLDL